MNVVKKGDGYAEDIIRSFVNLAAAEEHIKTLIVKYETGLENGLYSDENGINDRIVELNRKLDTYANLRRRAMVSLLNIFDSDDENNWCTVKHIGVASMQLSEAYQSSENTTIYGLWLDTQKEFIKLLSEFLGVEITSCAACFADMMKEKGDNKL